MEIHLSKKEIYIQLFCGLQPLQFRQILPRRAILSTQNYAEILSQLSPTLKNDWDLTEMLVFQHTSPFGLKDYYH